MDQDPTFRTRYDEAGLRGLLQDAEVFVDRLAMCVAGNDPHWLKEFADMTAPADAAIDEAVTVFKWYRRLAGDARKRNPILAALYKGG